MTKKTLRKAGVSPERLFVDWVSAAEGERFASLVKGFTEKIRKLGPLGEETELTPREFKTHLVAAKEVLAQEKTRWLVGRERELVDDKNVFGEKVSQEEFDQLILQKIEREFARRKILLSIADTPLSVREIAQRVNASPQDVLKNIVSLEREGIISVTGIDGTSPKYRRT